MNCPTSYSILGNWSIPLV